MSRIEKIKEMLQQNANDSFLLHALALEYIKLGNDQDALGCFLHLLQHNPDYLGSYYHLAKLYERRVHLKEAIATYETGIQLANKINDRHALNELRMALDDLTD